MTENVLYEQDGGVVTLTLNQPERRNPISEIDMVDALVAAVERLGADASVRAAVLTAEEEADLEDGGEVDSEAVLAAEMEGRAESPNLSFFAFTATPKQKTMELFGRKDANGILRAFHEYTMRQAIEEGFILDVLRGYQTYKTAFEIEQHGEAGAERRGDHHVDMHPVVAARHQQHRDACDADRKQGHPLHDPPEPREHRQARARQGIGDGLRLVVRAGHASLWRRAMPVARQACDSHFGGGHDHRGDPFLQGP